ncbi:MAG: hypothetical protein ABIN67_22370 [Ferruginibacter sp.]
MKSIIEETYISEVKELEVTLVADLVKFKMSIVKFVVLNDGQVTIKLYGHFDKGGSFAFDCYTLSPFFSNLETSKVVQMYQDVTFVPFILKQNDPGCTSFCHFIARQFEIDVYKSYVMRPEVTYWQLKKAQDHPTLEKILNGKCIMTLFSSDFGSHSFEMVIDLPAREVVFQINRARFYKEFFHTFFLANDEP